MGCTCEPQLKKACTCNAPKGHEHGWSRLCLANNDQLTHLQLGELTRHELHQKKDSWEEQRDISLIMLWFSGTGVCVVCRYWQTEAEREGRSPMQSVLPYIAILGLLTPFAILGLAFANGWIEPR